MAGGVLLTQGKVLGSGDLNLLVRDSQNNILDPYNIAYSIFQLDEQGNQTLVAGPQATPTRASAGAYYINITIPTTWHGPYRLVWYLIQNQGDPQIQVYEDFQVVFVNPASNSLEAQSVLVTPKVATSPSRGPAIMYVRQLLFDTNPDRNYHFRPPTPGKVVANYTTRVGFIWPDELILTLLQITISQLNYFNPMNIYSFTIDMIPDDWARIAALGAASKCLTAEGARWAEEEFSYSLNGVSLDINKSSLYQSLGQVYDQQFTTMAPLVTANRPFSAGLRQQRWLLG
jgi:hypothetical protein